MLHIRSVVDLLLPNLQWWPPVISSGYRNMLGTECWIELCMSLEKCCSCIITTICCFVFAENRYNDWLVPLIRQFLLIPNRIKEFMGPRPKCPTPALVLLKSDEFHWCLYHKIQIYKYYVETNYTLSNTTYIYVDTKQLHVLVNQITVTGLHM
jgi:hypothetical protein